ncbi:hypothetical protein AOC05_05045 [Arthrobacter alpinus]|uniref:Uncharacterized protein n=1 Tax=Arthrobacter alpinus TaxID=656366 RepID=A0A0M3UFY7_9MICC|nr:hypothetical protein [Arthrobacter alpinus]ALE91839.1 hypothetical protein AOC05_05045 [Arthrobacter alpinus]
MSAPKLYTIKDGEPVLSMKAVALLMGTTEEVISTLPRVKGNPQFTKHLKQSGSRVARKTMAHLGTDSIFDCIDYLATKETT